MPTFRKTKIICTLGPATSTKKKIKKLMDAGMNVARLNFSHGDHESHAKTVKKFKQVRDVTNMPIALMLDTKGPEFRIKTFEHNSVTLEPGQSFCLTVDDVIGNKDRVSVTYKNLCNEIAKGDIILLNDGLIILKVVSVQFPDVKCNVLEGGLLRNNKSMNFPNKNLNIKYLSDGDKSDLLFAIEHDFEYVAASFVSCAQDVIDVREFLNKNGGEFIDIIAKIENQSGIDNVEEILDNCCGLMVARGDLGVEVDFDQLPNIQKYLLSCANERGKLSITSTEMLESMIDNPRPTRAEISDVANAVFDGTNAVMLSGETAMGKHPIKAVKVMSKIAQSTENSDFFPYSNEAGTNAQKDSPTSALAFGLCAMAVEIGASLIVVFSDHGTSSMLLSKYKINIDIVSAAYNKKDFYKQGIYWGINPVLIEEFDNTTTMFNQVVTMSKLIYGLKAGDHIIISYGWDNKHSDFLSSVKIERI